MIMETISCGYPVAPSGLGTAPITPLSSPATPTGAEDFAPQLYAQTQFVQPPYSSSPLHGTGTFSKYDEDANNNNNIYNDNFNKNNSTFSSEDSLLNDLSDLSIAEERFSDLSPVSECSSDYASPMSQSPPSPASTPSRPKSKKNSRSKAKSSTQSQDGEKTRKDSFVYDVRLPDEQILFFVPDLDLVKSHLMFAVREEVDVLKDKIVELMDRIKLLECENTLLRQYASPDVLQQLQPQMSHQLQQQQQQQQQPPHHSSTS